MPDQVNHTDFMARFVPGLLDPDKLTPVHVAAHSGKAATRRYNVYRNNVTVSLVNSVGQIYPLTRKALGEDRFRGAALTYVRRHPPVSRLLFEYGNEFAAYIEEPGMAEDEAWIADLARLERAWLDAYHAADADPLAAAALAALPPERLADAVFKPHPAARLVQTNRPVFERWSALKAEGTPPAPPELGEAEALLVTRPALTVSVRALPPTTALFFAALFAGRTLGEAANDAMMMAQAAGDFDISAALTALLETGAFSAVTIA
jgi:hypothetical protein